MDGCYIDTQLLVLLVRQINDKSITVHPRLSEHVQISEAPSSYVNYTCEVDSTIVYHDYISI